MKPWVLTPVWQNKTKQPNPKLKKETSEFTWEDFMQEMMMAWIHRSSRDERKGWICTWKKLKKRKWHIHFNDWLNEGDGREAWFRMGSFLWTGIREMIESFTSHTQRKSEFKEKVAISMLCMINLEGLLDKLGSFPGAQQGGLIGGIRSLECPWRVYWDPQPLLSLLPGHPEVSSLLAICFHHDVLYHWRPQNN